MAEQEDREIFVDTRYPIPTFVDGISYIVPGEYVEEENWTTVQDQSPHLTLDDLDQANDIVQTPVPLSVVDQIVSYPVGGGAVVNAVLLIEEVPYVTDYEIRVVPR